MPYAVRTKPLYTAYYGYHSMHSRSDTARGLYHYLKRLRNKVDMLIDCLEIRDFHTDALVSLRDLYTEAEINEIFGW